MRRIRFLAREIGNQVDALNTRWQFSARERRRGRIDVEGTDGFSIDLRLRDRPFPLHHEWNPQPTLIHGAFGTTQRRVGGCKLASRAAIITEKEDDRLFFQS